MKFPIYTGTSSHPRSSPVELPAVRQSRFGRTEQYFPDPGLVDAVNVSLLLGQPLLLTGEPGTGKTQLAFSLARDLGLGDPLKFDTKSTCTASDLFYTYDSLKRFQDANERKAGTTAHHYLTFNAFGIAILRACPQETVRDLLPPGFVHGGQRRSVVLIDEVDKAPRDFPNDILNQLENMEFRVPELGNALVAASPDFQPVVVITSNSEKDLPDAFLRRCIYYHIPFPEDGQLREIIASRIELTPAGKEEFLRDALEVFRALRSLDAGLRKRPATAELLGWMKSLQGFSPEGNPLAQSDLALRTVGNLAKNSDDLPKAKQLIADWIGKRKSRGGESGGSSQPGR